LKGRRGRLVRGYFYSTPCAKQSE